MKEFINSSILKIREAIDNDKLVLFVGAGVSANSGLPTWYDLINTFAKELGIPFENGSVDSFLKISQYYYNDRKEKEYFDLIDKIFNINYEPNEIHKMLFEFFPQHVITTNYDELLEKQINQSQLLYDIVTKNEDLPYSIGNKMIIKMHGDLKQRNIVLKEDDYLNYNENFKLIDIFVKSLFSSYLILFVGFSPDDPNFKIVFHWVKNILKGSFKQAYLLECKNDFNRIEFNYYQNKGINILYYSEITKKLEEVYYEGDLKDNTGKKLYKFLKYIRDFEFYYYDIIDNIYLKLKRYEDLNYIFPYEISIIVKDITYGHNGDNYLYSSNQDLNSYVHKLNNDRKFLISELSKRKHKLKFIINTLKKSRIEGLAEVIEGAPKYPVIIDLSNYNKRRKKNELRNLLFEFNFIEIKKYLNVENFDVESNIGKYSLKSFYLYEIENYYEAYTLLKTISFSAFKDRKYTPYLLSEFNKKQLGPSLLWAFHRNYDTQIMWDLNENEIEKINLDNNFLKLSTSNRNPLTFLKRILDLNFVFEYLKDLANELEQTKKQKNELENGELLSDYSCRRILRDISSLWLFINENFLFIQQYSEIQEIYQIFLEIILINHSIKNSKKFGGKIRTVLHKIDFVKIHKIEYFHFYLIIRYFNSKKLFDIINENRIDNFIIEGDTKIKILKSFENIIKYNNEIHLGNFTKYISNLLIILSHIDITRDEFSSIIILIKEYSIEKFELDNIRYLNIFISGFSKKSKKNINVNLIGPVLELFLHKVMDNKTRGYYEEESLIKNLSYIIINQQENYFIKDDLLIDKILQKLHRMIKESKIKNCSEIIKKAILPIYRLSSESQKENFTESIYKFFNLPWDDANALVFTELYIKCIDKEIIKFDSILFEKYVKKVKHLYSKCVVPEYFYENFNICLWNLSELIIDEKINRNGIEKYLDEFSSLSDFFNFRINKKDFDYTKFNISWLKRLNDSEHKYLAKEFRNTISEKLKVKILKKNSKKIYSKLFFKYYCVSERSNLTPI